MALLRAMSFGRASLHPLLLQVLAPRHALQTQLALLSAPGSDILPSKRSRNGHCLPLAAVVTTTNFERGFTKGAAKREAARSVEFALQLCEISKRQMPKIQGALTEELSDAIALAQTIPKTNQARKRQVNLIAKLLRQLDEEELNNIKVLANGLEHGIESSFETGANNLAENWMAGLIAGDRATQDMMISFPRDWLDNQLIRHLTRRCQQLSQSEAAEGAEEEGEPQRKDPALSKAEKQLRKELRILAARHLQEGREEQPPEGDNEEEEADVVWVR